MSQGNERTMDLIFLLLRCDIMSLKTEPLQIMHQWFLCPSWITLCHLSCFVLCLSFEHRTFFFLRLRTNLFLFIHAWIGSSRAAGGICGCHNTNNIIWLTLDFFVFIPPSPMFSCFSCCKSDRGWVILLVDGKYLLIGLQMHLGFGHEYDSQGNIIHV